MHRLLRPLLRAVSGNLLAKIQQTSEMAKFTLTFHRECSFIFGITPKIQQTSEMAKFTLTFHSECSFIFGFTPKIQQTSECCASEWMKIYFHTQ